MINPKLFPQKSVQFINRSYLDDKRITILNGSVRSSKTTTMMFKWVKYLMTNRSGVKLMTGVSKDTIYDNVLRDMFNFVGRGNYSYNQKNGNLKIFDNLVKVVGCKDRGSEKYITGATFSGAYADEITLMPKNFFMQMLARCSPENSKIYGTCNPDSPYHYLYTDYLKDKKKLNIVESIHYQLDDNKSLSDEYKTTLKQLYTGATYMRLIDGLWVLSEGLVYENFDHSKMIIKDEELPDMIYYFLGGDYGVTNPTCLILMGVGVDRKIYVIDSYYHDSRGIEARKKAPSTYSKEIKLWYSDLKDKQGAKIYGTYVAIDPSASALTQELIKVGFGNIINANNKVLPGIQFVQSLIEMDCFRVCERNQEVINELGSYVFDKKKTELGKDAPLKLNDHCMDAIRYGVYSDFQKIRILVGV